MPIRIPASLPAASALERENIFVMTEDRAQRQDIRPLRILLLNLMPKKAETETQILRLLSNSPLQIDVEFLQTTSHISRNTPREHLIKFYRDFSDIQHMQFDGMIITGAPVEQIPFASVDYWEELCRIFDWSRTHVFSTLNICWGAAAALYYFYQIPRRLQKQKIFGVFPHSVLQPHHPLVRGFDETFYVPHSRYFYLSPADIDACEQLEILTVSHISGVHIVGSRDQRNYFITGHFEYDRDTLASEYQRDLSRGEDISLPYRYFPHDNPNEMAVFNWRCHANMLFSNWLNYVVYQNTPYHLEELAALDTST